MAELVAALHAQTATHREAMEVNLVQKEDIDGLHARIDKIQSLLKKVLSLENKSEYLNNEELCKHLSISKRTAQRIRDQKLIPYSQFGAKVIYKRVDVEGFIEKHRINSQAL